MLEELYRYPAAALRDELVAALKLNDRLVLSAPPGTGKTTVLPLLILNSGMVQGKILLLEPRRLAAIMAARRMAALLGEEVGQSVGYRTRLESKVSSTTCIEVITEGILTRFLQRDPELSGVGMVIFDEFHERHLAGDLALTLLLDMKEALREDLRLMLMSATLDVAEITAILSRNGHETAILQAEEPGFEVVTKYLNTPLRERSTPEAVIAAVKLAVTQEAKGDILVFLPGESEIYRVERQMQSWALSAGLVIRPLFGRLAVEEQEAALQPVEAGKRKVILSTNIAESSLTIENVRIVIDSGLTRRQIYNPATDAGMLTTMTAALATMDQRRGRAGRTSPGVCFRLWSEADEKAFDAHQKPEIEDAELTDVVLETALWGAVDARVLPWPTVPDERRWQRAWELLKWFGALDEQGRITNFGRELGELNLGLRTGVLLLKSEEWFLGETGVRLAALLSEGDRRRLNSIGVEELLQRLDCESSFQRERRLAAELCKRRRHGTEQRRNDSYAGKLLAVAFPERVGKNRGGDGLRFLLAAGNGALLPELSAELRTEWLVAPVISGDTSGADSRIRLAAALDIADLTELFAKRFTTSFKVDFDRKSGALSAAKELRLGSLVISSSPVPGKSPELKKAAVEYALRENRAGRLDWSETEQLSGRLRLMVEYFPEYEWPDYSPQGCNELLAERLEHYLHLPLSKEWLKELPLLRLLKDALPQEVKRLLDIWAPEHWVLPKGHRVRIDYQGTKPVLAARIQELLGYDRHPVIGNGRIPLQLSLLSPARRPVQITMDLPGFWRNSYFLVRSELRGRYPKHRWPDHPELGE